MNHFLALSDLLSGTFHQDWTLDGNTFEEVLVLALRDRSADELSSIESEARALLELGDQELRTKYFDELRSEWDPASSPQLGSVRKLLEFLLTLLRD